MTGNILRYPLYLALFALFIASPLLAQDDALVSPFNPSLGLAIPLKQEGESVIVTQKFLLNNNVIIQPGDQIRVIFPRPEVTDRDVRRKNSKKNLESALSRIPSKIDSANAEDDATKSSIYRAAVDRATRDSWKNEMVFRGYIDRMNLSDNILVFSRPGSDQLITDIFSFPQDLFLAESNGKIQVLAVHKESQAAELGIKAGDTLVAMNGKPLASLEDFLKRYFPEKQALTSQNEPLVLTFIKKGESSPKDIIFKLPMSLNSDPFSMDLPDPNATPQSSGTADPSTNSGSQAPAAQP